MLRAKSIVSIKVKGQCALARVGAAAWGSAVLTALPLRVEARPVFRAVHLVALHSTPDMTLGGGDSALSRPYTAPVRIAAF